MLDAGRAYCTPGNSRDRGRVVRRQRAGVALALPDAALREVAGADTMIMLVPADWICASIDVCAPVPSATIVMTAATPMIMPSIVSAVRILLRFSALTAIRRIIRNDMAAPYAGQPTVASDRRRPLGAQRVHAELVRRPAARAPAIRDDLTVAERHDARAVLGDVHLVRDQHHGDAALLVQALEDPHHFDAGPRVEVPGRLVREQDRRVVDQRAGDRDALLLSARQLVRMVVGPVAEPDQIEHLDRALVTFSGLHARCRRRAAAARRCRAPTCATAG